ncbi:MAG: DEAD/DEAH box helicase [Lentisphaeraceae bacterium]|nr:DEAD/DEAH box helicase [Lentisphaeraceae bacterium]
MSFEYPLELADSVLAKLKLKGIEAPFPVQTESAQLVYDGESLKIKAPTGSGKTLSYILPIGKLLADNFKLNLLVLTSSPELSSQIHTEFKEYYPDFSTALIVGGANLKRQKDRLKTRPRVIFGTPGRLFELFCLEKFSVTENTIVVMDESDTLLEGHSYDKVFALVEGSGQVITASATFNDDSESFLDELPHDVKVIDIKKREGKVHHRYVFCNDDKKEFSLIKLLRNNTFKKVLIFVNDIRHINHLFNLVQKEGLKVAKLDSKTTKNNREKAVKDLRFGEISVLVSTDSLARGIDIAGLSVIQYGIARELDIYIHRSGRVGRAGSEGWDISLVSTKDSFVLFKYSKKLSLELKEYEFNKSPKKKVVIKAEKEALEKPKKKRKKNRVDKNKGMRRKKL